MSQKGVVRSFIVGEGSLVVQCAEVLLAGGHEVCGLVTEEPTLTGWADARGIPWTSPRGDFARFLRSRPFDVLFSIVNLRMLSEELLRLPERFAVNFHDGPLPGYAGLHVTSWALLRRERMHGVTWHEMTAQADAGRILKQRAIEIASDETAFSLNAKCYAAGIESFTELVRDLEAGTLSPVAQDLARRRYFGLYERPPAACTLDWDASAEDVHALVAALEFGSYPNPMGSAKAFLGQDGFLVSELELAGTPSTAAPGTVMEVAPDAVRVATRDHDVIVRGLRTLDGESLSVADLQSRGLAGGRSLGAPEGLRERVAEPARAAARSERYWIEQLEGFAPLAFPLARQAVGASRDAASFAIPAAFRARFGKGDGELETALAAAVAAFLGRVTGEAQFHIGLSEPGLRDRARHSAGLFADQVPLRVALDATSPAAATLAAVAEAVSRARRHGSYLRDVLPRQPRLHALPRRQGQPAYAVSVDFVGRLEETEPRAAQVTFAFRLDGRDGCVVPEPGTAGGAVTELARRFESFLERLALGHDQPLRQLSLASVEEQRTILEDWNATRRDVPEAALVHELVAAQAARTPDAIAAVCHGRSLTYRDLDDGASLLARHLRGLGVGPDALVGIFMERSLEMLVAVLATLKAGGAYVPLDPAYPRERIAFMVEDAAIQVLLTQETLRASAPSGPFQVLAADAALGEPQAPPQTPAVTSRHLAYVIYTSGSTGRPKGVMVEHRNVVNFFTGMDERLGAGSGAWLAVTSLSFDISVLELLWTLTRGFKVVIHSGAEPEAGRSDAPGPSSRPMEMSLFYFSSDEGEHAQDKYELLLEGARFADANGFCAVWTPERHFHAFGGLYPNPAVTSAALATITTRVGLRAGSCVSPLHSPIRIAEEWAVVDNLSRGRVGISFASGWQPNDFAIRPEAFAGRKNLMFEQIEAVRRLWRGEALPFRSGSGKEVSIRVLPRPLQAELPVWVTSAGNAETFEMAGRARANVLTHLLGQSVKDVADKIAVYRRAWSEAGHEGRGVVTLMLHTFVGESDEAVKDVVREPMKAYLRSAVGLIKEAAWSFPTFRANTSLADGSFSTERLSAEEMDALLDHAFERYFRTSGLFGSLATCAGVVEELKRIDVDEIACLIDFGVPSRQVLEHLPRLAELLALAKGGTRAEDAAPDDDSIAALIAREHVTHLQCTPSMAAMLVADERSRQALSSLQQLLVGGEALPVALARQLERLVPDVVNMYGPTETTVWSSTHAVRGIADSVPIGRPIANTRMLVLDAFGQLAPVGALGELCIGGAGVVRGYLERPALTAERFVPDPFAGEGRLYRTGDMARFRPDGVIEFEGRLDQQVKLRGYRIELAEIESVLAEHPRVREAVVIAREDVPGDKRLVAYVVPGSVTPDARALRDHVRLRLPEHMVPAAFVVLDAFPLTPNRKVDRKALPPPEQGAAPATVRAAEAPQGVLEESIAAIWRDVLRLAHVGVGDNFFDLGGHSLLMVQVLERLKRVVEAPLSLVDLFRFPSIRTLARHLGSVGEAANASRQGAARAEARIDARARRRALQDRRRGPAEA